ncbi:MAG TPA: MOSC domain-containing protein [Verrucomicrobiae bacterium]|nr:MOSC domain-containing protein [Verrucomicrobiae bacterium]
MNLVGTHSNQGLVASLHLHPPEPGAPLENVASFEVREAKGIEGDNRYFGRVSRASGKPSRRQVTLMEREQIVQHARALGLKEIAPGMVRANIETTGIDLVTLVGCEIEIGEAILLLYAPRDPCSKMDAICQGLRERMLHSRQGVLAEVVRGGLIRTGDLIRVAQAA